MSHRRQPRKNKEKGIGRKADGQNQNESTPRHSLVITQGPMDSNESEKGKEENMPFWRNWSWWKTIQTVGIFAGIGYAIVTFFQWRDLRSNFETSQRPWVAIEDPIQITEPLTFSETDATVSIASQERNYGNSPALRTFSLVNLVIYAAPPGIHPFDPSDPKLRCNLDALHELMRNSMGISIFPGEINPPPGDISTARGEIPTDRSQGVNVWLKICVSYTDEFNIEHVTGRAWPFHAKPDMRILIVPAGAYEGTFTRSGISSAF